VAVDRWARVRLAKRRWRILEDMNVSIQQWRQSLEYRETPGARGAIREWKSFSQKQEFRTNCGPSVKP
jgi:hypothetical protein